MVFDARFMSRGSGNERSDGIYAFVAGFYINSFITPLIVLGLLASVTNAAILYTGFWTTVTLVTAAAGWIVYRMPDLAVQLGRSDAVWLLVIVPFAWFPAVFGIAAIINLNLPSVAVLLSVFGFLSGLFSGMVLAMMSQSRHANARLVDTEELAQWEARRWPQRWRWVAIGITIVAHIMGFIGLVSAAFGFEWGELVYVLIPVTMPLATAATNSRTIRVTDAGLVVGRLSRRRFRPWSDVERYALTDDALVVYSSRSWKPALRCARADIEDSKAAVRALETALATHA